MNIWCSHGACHQVIQLSAGSQRVWLMIFGEVCVTNYIFLSRFAEQRRKWQTLTSTWPSKLYSIFKLIQNTFQIICSTFEWWGQLCYFFTFLKTLKSKAHNQIVNCRTLHKSWGDDPELDNAYVHVHSLILKWDMGLGLGLSLQSSHQSRS